MSDKIGYYRWRIVALLFFATTINYIDRQVLGILAPELQEKFGWSESDYGMIIAAFQAAYAIGLLTTGRLLDRIGTRIGYSIAITLWSVAGMFHAAARSVFSFAVARFALGLGESANFPAAVKTVAEWFPKKERALATGLFNSGSSIGAILAPLLVPWIALNYGWQWAFIATGALGFVWLIFWLPVYRRPEAHTKLKSLELDHILQDGHETENKVPWRKIFPHRQTLGISLSLFLTAPIWWFFLYWLPKFLNNNHGIDLSNIGLPLIVIYIISDGGAILGGWLSSFMIKRGMDPIKARKRAILFLAFLVVPIFFAAFTSSLWVAVGLIALAAFSHQGYASNIFTIISDIYPKNAVGSMVGLSLFAGSIGGVLFSSAVGFILEATGNYYMIFGF
ncbi:MAG: MFS transporter, partial [Cyclobacteriaceae bacterium]|nr:MFS transporter [Cyclobacteriaceae bacterium]